MSIDMFPDSFIEYMREQNTIKRLRMNFLRSWSAATSADPDHWQRWNPAWGQCAVTALIVQDHLGGDLLRGTVDGISHYWNLLPSGEEVDLTREQFDRMPSGGPSEKAQRSREYVLSFTPTRKRYEYLKARVDWWMARKGRSVDVCRCPEEHPAHS